MRRFAQPLLWGLVAATLLVAWAVLVGARGMPADDALITLTFAKNLARGAGFVYNHPPPVLGTTTPLFTLVVAVLAALAPPLAPTAAAVALSGLCWAALPWVFYAFRRRLGLSCWQVMAVAALTAVGPFAHHLGMEASLFALLLVLAIGLFWAGRPLAAGLVTGLLFLTRGEGALLLPILLAVSVVRDLRRGNVRATTPRRRSTAVPLAAGFAAPVLLWAAFALPTFGVVLPDTLAAKVAQGSTGLWRPFAEVLRSEWLPQWGSGLRLAGAAVANLWYAGVLLGIGVTVWRQRRLLPLVLWGVAYVVGYSVLGVPAYPWYGVPVYFVLSVEFAVALGAVLDLLARRVRPPALAAGLATVLLGLAVIRLAPPLPGLLAAPAVSERHLAYRRLAAWLTDHAAPEASVAYHEIGYLGYYTDCRIIDLMGLVTPGVAERVAVGDFAWAFWHYAPDYLVYLQGSGFETAIVTDPRFPRLYREAVRFDGYDGRALTVFARRGSAARRASSP